MYVCGMRAFNVMNAFISQVSVDDAGGRVKVLFTPTIPHCSMATLIGLAIRVKLLRSLPNRFKVR